MEGLVENVESLLHDELAATFGGRVGYVLSRQAFRRFRRRVDYSEYGGAPLLGLNGLCIVGHGRSSAKAVANPGTIAVRGLEGEAGETGVTVGGGAVEEKLLDRLRAGVSALSAASASPSSILHPPTSR